MTSPPQKNTTFQVIHPEIVYYAGDDEQRGYHRVHSPRIAHLQLSLSCQRSKLIIGIVMTSRPQKITISRSFTLKNKSLCRSCRRRLGLWHCHDSPTPTNTNFKVIHPEKQFTMQMSCVGTIADTAPESLTSNFLSFAADVWAFGITMTSPPKKTQIFRSFTLKTIFFM